MKVFFNVCFYPLYFSIEYCGLDNKYFRSNGWFLCFDLLSISFNDNSSRSLLGVTWNQDKRNGGEPKLALDILWFHVLEYKL